MSTAADATPASTAGATPGGILLATVAKRAGLTGQALVTAVALGLSESGGNPSDLNNNPNTGDYSVGLWQINYYGSLGPGRTAEFGPPSGLTDAQKNANAMYTLSGKGTNWGPWQADFNNGSYYRNLPAAQASVAAINGGATPATLTASPATSGTGSGTGAYPGAAAAATGTLPTCHAVISLPSVVGIGGGTLLNSCQLHQILGGMVIAGGVILMFGGMVVILVATPQVGKVASTVATSVPGVGAVAGASRRFSGSSTEGVYGRNSSQGVDHARVQRADDRLAEQRHRREAAETRDSDEGRAFRNERRRTAATRVPASTRTGDEF